MIMVLFKLLIIDLAVLDSPLFTNIECISKWTRSIQFRIIIYIVLLLQLKHFLIQRMLFIQILQNITLHFHHRSLIFLVIAFLIKNQT